MVSKFVLIILAKQQDGDAVWLADHWQSHNAVLISPSDLSKSGWSLRLATSNKSKICAGYRQITNKEIDGVLTLIPRVDSEDLDHIVPSDRQYVASEMSAFLLAWLSSRSCPVLNRPTADTLGGPGWRVEAWVHFASELGIPVSAIRRSTSRCIGDAKDQSLCEITVIGDECFGNPIPQLYDNARILAKAAGTDLLTVRFANSEPNSTFVNANPWPNLASPELADALLHCFEKRSAC